MFGVILARTPPCGDAPWHSDATPSCSRPLHVRSACLRSRTPASVRAWAHFTNPCLFDFKIFFLWEREMHTLYDEGVHSEKLIRLLYVLCHPHSELLLFLLLILLFQIFLVTFCYRRCRVLHCWRR